MKEDTMHGAAPKDRRVQRWREIRHYAYAKRRFDDVWPLLVQSPGSVLGTDVDASAGAEASLHARLIGVEVSRPVRLRVGGVVCDDRRARLALRWEDAHHPRFFPVLEAILDLAPLAAGRQEITQVGVVGRYRPPFGTLGGLADRLAGEDVATESVSAFVDGLVRRLEALVPEPTAEEEPPEMQLGSSVDGPDLQRVFVSVDGLNERAGGAAAVNRYLAGAPGVVRAEVHPLSGLARVDYDPELCNPTRLMEDLEDDREWFNDRLPPEPPPTPGSDV